MEVSSQNTTKETNAVRMPRILLVDDDPVFGKVMGMVALRERVPLTFISSVEDLDHINSHDYDLGIFDYDLGPITGLQLSGLLNRYLGDIPVILISQYKHMENRSWPKNVRQFISKAEGAYGIISRALSIYAEGQPQ